MPKEFDKLSKRQKLRQIARRVNELNVLTPESNEADDTGNAAASSSSTEVTIGSNICLQCDVNESHSDFNLQELQLNQEHIQNVAVEQENDEDFDSDALPEDSSSDEDSDNDDYYSDESTSDLDFQSELCDIVLEGHLTQKITNKLLRLLKNHGHDDLPNDRRTLLKTTRNTSLKLQANSNGKYYHFGLETCIRYLVSRYFETIPDELKINISVDGVPLAKSSKSQFWPIMISVVSNCYTEPKIVGIYHGFSKPSNVNEYLRPLVDDYHECRRLGVNISGHLVQISINAVICDAPARSFVTGTKQHNAYFGCPKCIQEGDFLNNRMTFPETDSLPRTDDSFRRRLNPEHHKCYSCIEELLDDIILRVPVDYMHCICLGIVRRILWFFSKGPMYLKLLPDTIEAFSNDLINMKSFITREFARKPRHLKDIKRWKATECRQFLLYTGLIVLKNHVHKRYYDHFLCLSVAIRILADEEFSANRQLLNYAKELLVAFVNHYAELYGAHYISYNVHVALHLPECVEIYGCLDNFSAFKFENELQKLKNKIKVNDRVLEQAVNIISGEYSRPVKVSLNKVHPKLHYKINSVKKEIKYAQFSGFRMSSDKNDNCCLLQNGKVALISRIYKESSSVFVEVRCFSREKPLFINPCDSRKFFISVVSSQSLSSVQKVRLKDIKRKCLKVEQDNKFIVIPLLHVNN